MSLSSFSVRRRVTTGMIFLAVTLLGLVSFTRLPVDLFPDVEMPTVSVITYYFGASARDVEEKVTDPLEESLAVTPGLEEMSSVSQENVSAVTLQFAWGSNLDEAMNDVRTRIDFARRNLPEDVEDPLLLRLNLSMLPIVTLGVTSSRGDIQEQGELVDDLVAERIERIDGVASVISLNQQSRQVLVEVDRQRLEDYHLSLQQVAGVIQMENLTLPAGTIDVGRITYIVRVPGEYETIDELRNVIVSQNEGSVVYLHQVASVHEGLEESDSIAAIDGHPAILYLVQRESGANTVEVARRVVALCEQLERELPENLHIVVLEDQSSLVTMMLDNLTDVVWTGAILVIVITFLALRRFRPTLIISLSIPTCLIAVFAMLWVGGFTLNIVSLASIALAIGVVVDPCTVVLDNIMRHIDAGRPRLRAAIDGAHEVTGAVVASSLTNLVIFAPVIFVSGILGVFFDLFAYVTFVALGLSLLVAIMLSPMLASVLLRERDVTGEDRLYRWLGRPLDRLEEAYGRLLRLAVSTRRGMATTMIASVVVFVVTIVPVLLVGQDFLPSTEGGNLSVEAHLPIGTSTEHTAEVARRIEEVIGRHVPEAQHAFYRVGRSSQGLDVGTGAANNVAMVGVTLPPLAERARTNAQIEAALREPLSRIPGIVTLDIGGGSFTDLSADIGGRDLLLEVLSPNETTARRAAEWLDSLLATTPGATDRVSDLQDEIPELRIQVDRQRAARLGVPMSQVASAVRMALHGHAVTRFRGGDQDIEIYLNLRSADRRSLDDLRNLTVPSLSGAQVRLGNIAEVSEESSPMEIRHFEGNRTLRVMANIEGPLNEARLHVERALALARARGDIAPEVEVRFAGDVQDQKQMIVDLSLALVLAILLVYMVMAAQFESFLDPFVIMFSVPFGISGVFLALLLTGTTLQVTSFMGMIITVGIVVANAIVLIDYINEMRRQGMPLHDAVITGGARRLRPVLITSLTTFASTVPLALATGEGASIWRPMGVACTGGLLVSMLVTLVLIPAVYMATERWRKIRGPEPDA
jgi:HAE1 family hydrophobic/amphiphilic exporter-1